MVRRVADRVWYTRRDYPGGTTITSTLPATIIKFGKKKVKIRLDRPHTPLKSGFRSGKPFTEVWVEPHNIGLPMRKDYKRASDTADLGFGIFIIILIIALIGMCAMSR